MTDLEILELKTKGAQRGWGLVYEKAYNDRGELLFPERLGWDELKKIKKEQGTYVFANQYLNQVIPDDQKKFRKEWYRNYTKLPSHKLTFAFIDPSTGGGTDYTALVVMDVDQKNTRYVRVAQRFYIQTTEIVDLIFEVNRRFKPAWIGVEEVAFQVMIVQLVVQRMKATGEKVPIAGIKAPNNETKEMRLLGLVPWIQWGDILFADGLVDLQTEMFDFPRGSHDDLLDALEAVNRNAHPPQEEKDDERPNPASEEYERWFRKHGLKNRRRDSEESF